MESVGTRPAACRRGTPGSWAARRSSPPPPPSSTSGAWSPSSGPVGAARPGWPSSSPGRWRCLPDGVHFVDLARVAGPDGVADALRAVLGLDEIPGLPADDAAVEHLAGRSGLVLLDNCEHLVDAASSVAGRLVAECDGIRVLATSREPLGSPGEASYRVPSLPVPTHDEDVECASVALFADRARLARAPHGYPASDLPAVLQICRILDGLPLAIELAAAPSMFVSTASVKTHLIRIFRKLEVRNRAELAAQARDRI